MGMVKDMLMCCAVALYKYTNILCAQLIIVLV